MIKEVSKCTTTFAKSYTKKWIQSNLRTNDMDGTSKEISAMLTEKFPQFSHTVVVYPPVSGFSKHTTNFGITMFRWKEMNIVVSILYRKENRCESPDRILSQFLTYKTISPSARNGLKWEKERTKKYSSAHNMYKALESYGNTRLHVFKGYPGYSVKGYPNNIWCEQNYGTFTIVYI